MRRKSRIIRVRVTTKIITRHLSNETKEAIKVLSRGCRRGRDCFLGRLGPSVRLVVTRVGQNARKFLLGSDNSIRAILGCYEARCFFSSVKLKKVMARLAEEREKKAENEPTETRTQETPPPALVTDVISFINVPSPVEPVQVVP